MVELFESVLASLSWAWFNTPATSAMERSFKAGVIDLKERNSYDELELTTVICMQSGFDRVAGWEMELGR